MARRRLRPYYAVNLALSLVVLAVFSLAGVRVAQRSSAASADPYGFADYCALENNTTVIYGWAADPDAGSLALPDVTINAGGEAVTVPTNRAGYRDAAINAWIEQNRPGDPKPGTYGFRAPMPGLYKGSKNTITGTVLNEGAGSSVVLNINNSGYTDGDSSKPYFAGNVIPDVCLANQAAPAPAPAPQPAPTKPAPAPSATATPPKSTTPNAADAAVTTGTLAASLAVPSDGATAVSIIYGKDPVHLDQSTANQSVSGDSTDVLLTGLDSTSTYTYQIVRTAATGKTTTSLPGTFTTLGYVVAVHFVDNRDKGIEGIQTRLGSTTKKQTSNEDGAAQFQDVSGGNHTLTYTYKDKTYTKVITASPLTVSPKEATSPAVVTLDFTINIEAGPVGTTARPAVRRSNPWPALILVIFCMIGLIVAAIVFTRKGRKSHRSHAALDAPPPPLPEYHPVAPTIPTLITPNEAQHVGESLKDMVLRSMAEQAKRREQEGRGPDDLPKY